MMSQPECIQDPYQLIADDLLAANDPVLEEFDQFGIEALKFAIEEIRARHVQREELVNESTQHLVLSLAHFALDRMDPMQLAKALRENYITDEEVTEADRQPAFDFQS